MDFYYKGPPYRKRKCIDTDSNSPPCPLTPPITTEIPRWTLINDGFDATSLVDSASSSCFDDQGKEHDLTDETVSGRLHETANHFIQRIDRCFQCKHSGDGWCCEHYVDGCILVKTCNNCSHPHTFDDTIPVHEMERYLKEELAHLGLFCCAVCANENPDMFTLGENHILCLKCERKNYDVSAWPESAWCSSDEDFERCMTSVFGHGDASEFKKMRHNRDRTEETKVEKELIRDSSLLTRGDHIAWARWYGIYHHALVVEAGLGGNPNLLLIIEMVHSGCIYRDVKLDKVSRLGSLYRYNYTCEHTADEAIGRGESEIGVRTYNLLTRNCEHFVRWCKTGVSESYQVKSFMETLKELYSNMLLSTRLEVLEEGVESFLTAIADMIVSLGDIAAGVVSLFPGMIGAVIGAAKQLHQLIKEWRKINEEHVAAKYDDHEKVNMKIRSACAHITQAVTTIVGGIIGGLIFPFIGEIVGAVFGRLIGAPLGRLIGTLITLIRNKLTTDESTELFESWE